MAELLSGSTVGGFLIALQNNDNAFCDITATQLKIIKLGNQTALIDNNGNFTTSSGLINSEVANSSSQIGFTLNTPNYTTQGQKLISINNGTNEQFSIDKDGNIFVGKGISLNRNKKTSGISFYMPTYNQWQMYMQPCATGNGYNSNVTQPTGSIVTSWALRSFIESNSGYGWTWEKGASTATSPEIVAELGVNGNFRTVGEITATKFIGSGVSLTNVPWQSLTGKPTTLSGYGITDGVNTVDVVTTATANKILKLDSNQKLPQSITGNQETTTKLQTQRTIQLAGQVTGSQSFDGSQNISITTTLASHTHTSQQISDQTNANTANMIVKRDQSGNFSAGTITQQLSGNQSTATKLQTQRSIQLTGQVTGSQNFDGSQNVSIATTLASHTHTSQQISDQTNANTANMIVKRDQSGNFSAGTITQQLSGNQSTATKLQTQRSIQLTGQVTGSQNFDGSQNVSIATTLASHTHTSQQISDQTNANTASTIVARDQSGNFSAGTITQQLSGNQSTATKLQAQRTIQLTGQVTGSQNFDGSQNVSISTTVNHNHDQSYLGINGGTSTIADSSSQIGFTFQTPNYTTTGQKLFSIKNNVNEKFSIDKDGNITSQGEITATKVKNAVYNDYQEYRNSVSRIEAGYVCIESESGNIELCKKDRQKNIQGIQSDTYGTIMGDSNQNNTPVSVQGRVLVYAENKNNLKLGDQVCSSKNGKIRKMKWYEKILFPEQIVGIVSEFPSYETWGTDNVSIDGRIWINVRR